MYDESAKTDGYVDNKKRLENAKAYFNEIEYDKSLVFHYANYSNPLSTDDEKKYVIIGVSRIKKLDEIKFYRGTDAETKEKYGGAYIWQRNVETHYPDQGLRIPYHRYLDKSEILKKIALFPENNRCFKYGSRHISDDDALSLIERLVEIANYLRDINDDSENWSLRIEWLNSLLAELWSSRGLYPGLARVLDLVGLSVAVTPLREAVSQGKEKAFNDAAFDCLNEKASNFPGMVIDKAATTRIRRQWKLKTGEERQLLSDTLPRFDIPKDQIERILSSNREQNCVYANLEEIAANPYLLVEQYIGDNPDDMIPFGRIDHGVFPSPELGGEFLYDTDDWRRLRALCVDRLRYETKHTFLSIGQILQDINNRLAYLPDWKRVAFTEQYFGVDREPLSDAITFRKEGTREYAYLKSVYAAEREIEDRIRKLAGYSNITFKSPVTEKHWKDLLFEAKSPLAEKTRQEYEQAIAVQSAVCTKIFSRPVSVIYGAAGTGKTTIIKAILQAIEKAHGPEATFLLLAPTGKAADRIREKAEKPAKTIHSFLASHGWLNDNLTIKPFGGQKEDVITTFVIDEASMLNPELMAALFRAINWSAVQRLIIVGDPNQLPPIGRGKVFADTIDWLRTHHPDSIGELTVNLRQMENRVGDRGTGILDLAALYVRAKDPGVKDEEEQLRAEEMFQRLQDLPTDGAVDKDLRIVLWKDAHDLLDKLVAQMIADLEEDSGLKYDSEASHKLWLEAIKSKKSEYRADYHQVISPYLNEGFGTSAINDRLQQEARGGSLDRIGSLDGFTLFDKVIQIRNRGQSDPLRAWNYQTKANEPCEVFNGELGYVIPHGFDKRKWKWEGFWFRRFCSLPMRG